ncbi:sodium:solute symporter family protein [Allosalinactinospora lopnorensis]|uniref:sodium:solute symporter family protein n=1 Tax=Allosalinactinospora lopnorensis TaxID=1352348 RepID=UPI000623BB7B|nr:sodium:solute symporter family protein [Allosalinactinospora lopnorensis]
MTVIDWAMLALYFAALIVIGVQTVRLVTSSHDYAVAGNRIVWPVLFGSLAASFLGGGASMGNASNTADQGYVYFFAFSAFALSAFLVGTFVAPHLKRYVHAHTVGDIMEAHYGRGSRLITGVLSLLVCTGILGAQALAVGVVINLTIGMAMVPAILIGMGIVVLYSTFGGAWAVIQTDMLQFVFLGLLLPVTLLIGLFQLGGAEGLFAAMPEGQTSLIGQFSAPVFIGLFLAFLLGETLVPPYAQRVFSTPDGRNARKGMMLTGAFSLLFYFVTATIGLVCLALFPDRIAGDQAIPTVVMELLPVGLTGLAIAALLAVVMSTASSYLNSCAIVFVKDVYKPFIHPGVSDRSRLALERVLTLVVGAGAILFAVSVPGIVDALLHSYSFWAPTIVIPLLAALLLRVRSAPAAWSAIISGGLVTYLWDWVIPAGAKPGSLAEWDGLVFGVLVNLAVFTAVAYATRNHTPPLPDRPYLAPAEEKS